MKEWAAKLRKTHSQQACLRVAYDLITSRYHGERVKTYVLAHRLLIKNTKTL